MGHLHKLSTLTVYKFQEVSWFFFLPRKFASLVALVSSFPAGSASTTPISLLAKSTNHSQLLLPTKSTAVIYSSVELFLTRQTLQRKAGNQTQKSTCITPSGGPRGRFESRWSNINLHTNEVGFSELPHVKKIIIRIITIITSLIPCHTLQWENNNAVYAMGTHVQTDSHPQTTALACQGKYSFVSMSDGKYYIM